METGNPKSSKVIYHSLNFVKCIAVFAVICIHCDLHKLGTEGLVIDAICRFSVLIFFLIAVPILIFFSLFVGEFCAKAGFSFTFEYYRNFLLMALPFFTLGYLIHDKKDILTENISNIFLIAFGIFGVFFDNS